MIEDQLNLCLYKSEKSFYTNVKFVLIVLII